MNGNFLILTLKIKDRHIVRFQISSFVPDIEPYSIQDVVTVRFNNELTTGRSRFTEQAAEGGLGARMKMHFRLLKQEHWWSIWAKQLRNYGQDLAHTVSYVDKIPLLTLPSFAQLGDFQLEWSSFHVAKLFYANLMKQSGTTTKFFQLGLQARPLLVVLKVGVGKISWNV